METLLTDWHDPETAVPAEGAFVLTKTSLGALIPCWFVVDTESFVVRGTGVILRNVRAWRFDLKPESILGR